MKWHDPALDEIGRPKPVAFVEKATTRACTTCGQPIQPGQAWTDKPNGVRHLGCRPTAQRGNVQNQNQNQK